jgi:DNA modification methylase
MTNIFEAGITPDRENANEGTQRGRGLLEKSLRKLGAGRSILTDKDGNVIAGNKTIEAAADIDLPVRIVETDGSELVVVKRTDLDLYSETDKRARQLAYADNKVAEIDLAWKPEQIAVDFEPLDLGDWGFDDPNPPMGDAEPQIDRAAELNEKWQVKTGDLWQIGEHRLLCGDSTKREDVERVMDGEKADVMFTDPPYNIGMKATSKEREIKEIENDKMDDEDFRSFLAAFLESSKNFVDGDVYICCDWRKDHIFKKCMSDVGWPVKCVIVWDKEMRAQNLNKWAFAHEYILYYGYFGTPTLDTNVWRFKREYSDVHLTPKPVELVEKAISSAESNIIYDGFCGSGTTMVACENLSRKCRAIEISPNYCSVILQRMTDAFPGIEIQRMERA